MPRKSKPVGLEMSNAQFEAFCRGTASQQKSLETAAADITRQLLEAEKRRAASAEPSGAQRRGAFPPPANRGGKWQSGSDETISLVLEGGKVKEILKRRGYGGSCAFVDWINFTVGVETFDDEDSSIDHEALQLLPTTDNPAVVVFSRHLSRIFGFGVTGSLGYGQHFYQASYSLGEGWGTVSIGGQNETVLVSISGTGLAAAKEGWEIRLKTFLQSADRSRITRVDLAHDDYTGATYSVNRADQDHTSGLFNCGGRNPRCEYRGDWKNPDGSGRSFYVGNRKNGKFCRVYEKGRELGDEKSEWVRVEVEFKGVDRVIPFDVLTAPGEYLAASYPAFVWIAQHQERIETTQKVTQAGVDKAVRWMRHQCGAYVHYLTQLLGVEEFHRLVSRDDKEPAFMKVPHYIFGGQSIHEGNYSPIPA